MLSILRIYHFKEYLRVEETSFHLYRIGANKPPAIYKNFTLSRWWSIEIFSNFWPKSQKKWTFGQKRCWFIRILYWWWSNQEWRSIFADTVIYAQFDKKIGSI